MGMGAERDTIRNWEGRRTEPEVRFLPTIIAFLGYNPLPEGTGSGEQVRRARLSLGWSRSELAMRAGVDEATVQRIEADTKSMARRSIARVRNSLGL